MARNLTIACVQMNSGPDIHDNLKQAETFIRDAAVKGATLIATPEVTDQVVSNRAEKIDQVFSQGNHPGVPFFANLAKELSVTLVIGSMCIKTETGKIANRSFVFSPAGDILAHYDKIHLFDVDLPTGESHRESKIFAAGDRAVTVQTPEAKLGLSVCYDVRFSHLYRDLAKAGAEILSIPAAFTVPTGQAHWEVLLRARAIETGSFVMAAAQSGDHMGARKTYGHSMIISPWGEVLENAGTRNGIISAMIDLDDVARARAAIPALKHDRDYSL